MMVDGLPSAPVNIHVEVAPEFPAPSSACCTRYFHRGIGRPNGSKFLAPSLSSADAVPQRTYLRAMAGVGGSKTSFTEVGETIALATPRPKLANRERVARILLQFPRRALRARRIAPIEKSLGWNPAETPEVLLPPSLSARPSTRSHNKVARRREIGISYCAP